MRPSPTVTELFRLLHAGQTYSATYFFVLYRQHSFEEPHRRGCRPPCCPRGKRRPFTPPRSLPHPVFLAFGAPPSQADVLVAATDASNPARIRNAAVGIESYADLAPFTSAAPTSSRLVAEDTTWGDVDTTLSVNVMTCADNPCGGGGSSGGSNGTATATAATEEEDGRRLASSSSSVGEDEGGEDEEKAEGEGGFAETGCRDGNLGVYCPCFFATVTGEEVREKEGSWLMPSIVSRTAVEGKGRAGRTGVWRAEAFLSSLSGPPSYAKNVLCIRCVD